MIVFQALIKAATAQAGLPEGPDWPRFPHYRDPLPEGMSEDRLYAFDVLFPRDDLPAVLRWRQAFAQHLARERKFSLEFLGDPQVRRPADPLAEHPAPPAGPDAEVCLDFLTPLPLPAAKAARRLGLDAASLFELIARRARRLLGSLPPEFLPPPDPFRVHPQFWHFQRFTHAAKSQPGTKYLDGGCGPLYLRGPLERAWPLLCLGAELQAGPTLFGGLGCYRLDPDRPCLDLLLRDPRWLTDAIAAARRESDLLDDPELHAQSDAQLADALARDFAQNAWQPAPAQAAAIPKANGEKRRIATLAPADCLVHKLLHRVLRDPCELLMEDSSLAFQRGKSRSDALPVIRQAQAAGRTVALRADVQEFFDQVPWDRLERTLDEWLPRGDRLVRELLSRCLRTPLREGRRLLPRDRGLLQGSPLSPLLANIYLDPLDEALAARGYTHVRFADDLLLLLPDREAAARAQAELEALLAELGLQLQTAKTQVGELEDEGLSFLGLDLGPGLEESELAAAALRRPLVIHEPYAYLGADADAVVVRRGPQLLARLPLRQLEGIVVIGAGTVSTRLLERCARHRLPISFCTPGGAHINTLCPDSQAWFERLGRHAQRHAQLDDPARLHAARRLVRLKLQAYRDWIAQLPAALGKDLRLTLDRRLRTLDQAQDLDALRGHEGAAARAVFPFLMAQIHDETLRAPSRQPHTGADPANALLDFASYLLHGRLNVLLRVRGLNPYLGFLHSHRDWYESLVYDLMEPHRARLDRFLLRTLNRRIVTAADFAPDPQGRPRLQSPAAEAFIRAFYRELALRLSGDALTLGQLLDLQVAMLIRWVDGEAGLNFPGAPERESDPRAATSPEGIGPPSAATSEEDPAP